MSSKISSSAFQKNKLYSIVRYGHGKKRKHQNLFFLFLMFVSSALVNVGRRDGKKKKEKKKCFISFISWYGFLRKLINQAICYIHFFRLNRYITDLHAWKHLSSNRGPSIQRFLLKITYTTVRKRLDMVDIKPLTSRLLIYGIVLLGLGIDSTEDSYKDPKCAQRPVWTPFGVNFGSVLLF